MSEVNICCSLCSATKNQPEGTTPIDLIDGFCRWCTLAWNAGHQAGYHLFKGTKMSLEDEKKHGLVSEQ